MTVQEWFEGDGISRETIDDTAGDSEYSASVSRFIGQNWETDVEDLTPKQAAWASRILDDMVERRIQRRKYR